MPIVLKCGTSNREVGRHGDVSTSRVNVPLHACLQLIPEGMDAPGPMFPPCGELTPAFLYFTQPYVDIVAPRAGPMQGGSLVTVTGREFPRVPSGEALLCRFEAYTAPGRYINSRKVPPERRLHCRESLEVPTSESECVLNLY